MSLIDLQKQGRIVVKGVYVSLFIVVVFYLVTRALPMLIVTRENYTDYYWPRAGWLFLHVLTGILTTSLGVIQFFPNLRKKSIRLHKLNGYVYVLSVGIAATGAGYLALTTKLNSIYSAGLLLGAIVWVITTAIALYAVKIRNVNQHQEWMTRSYVVSLFFIIYMFIKDICRELNLINVIGTEAEASALLVWVSWTVPLFLTEVVLQLKKLIRSKK